MRLLGDKTQELQILAEQTVAESTGRDDILQQLNGEIENLERQLQLARRECTQLQAAASAPHLPTQPDSKYELVKMRLKPKTVHSFWLRLAFAVRAKLDLECEKKLLHKKMQHLRNEHDDLKLRHMACALLSPASVHHPLQAQFDSPMVGRCSVCFWYLTKIYSPVGYCSGAAHG